MNQLELALRQAAPIRLRLDARRRPTLPWRQLVISSRSNFSPAMTTHDRRILPIYGRFGKPQPQTTSPRHARSHLIMQSDFNRDRDLVAALKALIRST